MVSWTNQLEKWLAAKAAAVIQPAHLAVLLQNAEK